MKRLLFMVIAVIGACSLLSVCAATGTGGFRLRETPQVYVLQGDEWFRLMPEVTLYENGSARLSQPLISSFAHFGLGSYTVHGNELTVTHGPRSTAVFEISDGGDTLTLKSSTVGFTKSDSVYKARSNADYLRQFTHVDGGKLTLDVLRKMAGRASTLSASDFEAYEHTVKDPDYHIYDVEGTFTLTVVRDADGNTTCMVERRSSGETFPLHQNGSTGVVFDAFLGLTAVPKYDVKKWVDFTGDEKMPWGTSLDMTLREFPGVTFTWTPEKVTAGDRTLFGGMPVWNVYLADLTNDGKPELCATVSFGSGIVDTRVLVCDVETGAVYQLSDRMRYDYHLSMQDGKLMLTQTDYASGKPLVASELRLVNGELFRISPKGR